MQPLGKVGGHSSAEPPKSGVRFIWLLTAGVISAVVSLPSPAASGFEPFKTLVAVTMGILFASIVFVCSPRSRTQQPLGWLVFVLGIMGFGSRYGELKRVGFSSGDARADAFLSGAGLAILVGIAIVAYARRRKMA